MAADPPAQSPSSVESPSGAESPSSAESPETAEADGALALTAESVERQTGFVRWLLERARAAGSAVVSRALVLWYAARDPDTPMRAKAVIIGALAYLVEPIDAIPDLTPLLGYTDDMTVLGLALTAVVAYVKPAHREAARRRAAEIFGEELPESEGVEPAPDEPD